MTTVNLDQKTIDAIFTLTRTLRKRTHYNTKDQHLSPIQAHTMFLIKDRQPIAMHELAECFQITKPTATSIINVLIKDGYVVRLSDKGDRRIIRIKLSKKGEDYLTKNFAKTNSRLSGILSFLNRDEKESLKRIFEKINTKLEEDYEKNK